MFPFTNRELFAPRLSMSIGLFSKGPQTDFQWPILWCSCTTPSEILTASQDAAYQDAAQVSVTCGTCPSMLSNPGLQDDNLCLPCRASSASFPTLDRYQLPSISPSKKGLRMGVDMRVSFRCFIFAGCNTKAFNNSVKGRGHVLWTHFFDPLIIKKTQINTQNFFANNNNFYDNLTQ